jgi:3-methyladenine DNA glycosylase/8-oxoguanine DNA glycosylase
MNATHVKNLSKKDRILAKHMKKVGPIKLAPDRNKKNLYESLAQAIVYQQLHGKAAATIFGRVCALFKNKKFPKPEELLSASEVKLREAGLSKSKLLALKDLAAKTIEGIVPSMREIKKLSDDEIRSRLIAIRGIGPWTVEMMLIFKLGRSDVLPVTDYGVRKGFSILFKTKDLPTPKALAEFGEKWAPYRTTAAWYLWRAADLAKLKKQ